MPSTAEAFGLMAVEAMGAGRQVVCFEGTALPSVTHAPECGIAVPMGDSSALRAAIDRLARHPEEAALRGRLGRLLAAEEYDHDRYLDSITEVYGSAAERASGA
jgi:glycosyltransferase involved in cell wall biosynthesis